MGCGESKIKSIKLKPDVSAHKEQNNISVISGTMEAIKPMLKMNQTDLDETSFLPNRLLSAIPVSDLGDSLDSRYLSESLNLSHGLNQSCKSTFSTTEKLPDDASCGGDSGYDEYEDDYSFIITEHSSQDLVSKVEREFMPVDLPELLVITGRACARIMSGYQKSKLEETRILEALREEGLLAKPKGKTSGGMSFEVVDVAVAAADKSEVSSAKEDLFVSSKFIPSRTLARLEMRRGTIRRPVIRIDEKLELAEVRRKAVEEEKVKNVVERTGLERHARLRSASAYQREQQYSATIAKRQQQLQEIRDRLKDKHKKNDLIKLKKQLLNDSSAYSSPASLEHSFNLSSAGILQFTTVGGKDNFFDD